MEKQNEEISNKVITECRITLVVNSKGVRKLEGSGKRLEKNFGPPGRKLFSRDSQEILKSSEPPNLFLFP
jgi:hypothetical protein